MCTIINHISKDVSRGTLQLTCQDWHGVMRKWIVLDMDGVIAISSRDLPVSQLISHTLPFTEWTCLNAFNTPPSRNFSCLPADTALTNQWVQLSDIFMFLKISRFYCNTILIGFKKNTKGIFFCISVYIWKGLNVWEQNRILNNIQAIDTSKLLRTLFHLSNNM